MVPWLHKLSLPGVCKVLKRLNVRYKRGRAHVHSPDLLYEQKLADISNARILAHSAPKEVVFLYEDEFTFFSRPLVGRCYQPKGGKGAKATGAALVTRRIAGCLDVATGAVIARQRDRFNVKEMYRFFYFVEKHYPDADVIYIALDNWPVHFHGYVRDHLAARHSRIRLLPLPTYARLSQSDGEGLAQALPGDAYSASLRHVLARTQSLDHLLVRRIAGRQCRTSS